MGQKWVGPAPSDPKDLVTKEMLDDVTGGLKTVKITAAAFAALGTKAPNTIYFVAG